MSLDSTTSSVTKISNYVRTISPHEEALQALIKQILKSRLFRGFYEERRYVDIVEDYRDIVALEHTEIEFQKIILDIKQKLLLFYQHLPNIWIGITNGTMPESKIIPGALNTFIWVELDNLAFGQYWFLVKSIRFRDNEIVLKLKMVRPVEPEKTNTPLRRRVSPAPCTKTIKPLPLLTDGQTAEIAEAEVDETITQTPIGLQDFLDVVQNWGYTIKRTTYEFMSNDISKENIVALLKFIGLVIISLLTASVAAVKFLGTFTLRFMFEFSRLTRVLTPIIIKIIDVFNKIVGGFYILIAMIWKDVTGKRETRAPNQAIDYNRPLYKSITYDIQQNRGNTKTN